MKQHWEVLFMIWQLCIQYANGSERVLRSFSTQENALKWVDVLYNVHGYPLHYAYIVRHAYIARHHQLA